MSACTSCSGNLTFCPVVRQQGTFRKEFDADKALDTCPGCHCLQRWRKSAAVAVGQLSSSTSCRLSVNLQQEATVLKLMNFKNLNAQNSNHVRIVSYSQHGRIFQLWQSAMVYTRWYQEDKRGKDQMLIFFLWTENLFSDLEKSLCFFSILQFHDSFV